jgi:poly(A) polymerase
MVALKRFLARPTALLSRALFAALPGTPGEIESRLRDLAQTEFAPPPLITGDDLVAAGYAPGPAFKRVLDAVYDAQLEDRIQTQAEAMTLAKQLFESSNE